MPRPLIDVAVEVQPQPAPLGAAAYPLQKPRKLPRLSALKVFFGSVSRDASKAIVVLEGKVDAAADHGEIILWSFDDAPA
jgi:hypothetical protein